MTHTSQDISPLRQRLIDDMRMRKLAPKTQAGYVRVVRQFAAFLGRRPDTATVEDLRRYQLHLVDHGISPVSLNAAITGLKFFFEITLNQPQLMARMQPVRVPRTLPVVLSPDEVARLIAAAGNLKHQTALSVAYGAGLRASEVVALKVGDVDSHRMTLRIEQGKGRRDRYAMLSPVLLERLRVWWRVAHAQGRMLEGGWLFPGLDLMSVHSAGALTGGTGTARRACFAIRRCTRRWCRFLPLSVVPSCCHWMNCLRTHPGSALSRLCFTCGRRAHAWWSIPFRLRYCRKSWKASRLHASNGRWTSSVASTGCRQRRPAGCNARRVERCPC
jgi:integrase